MAPSRAWWAAALLPWLAACGGSGPAPDPCAAAGACTSPPAATCPSAATALVYPAVGTCTAAGQAAVCDYLPALVDCAATGQVCAAGACVAPADPCAAVGVCTTPPPDDCATASQALHYPASGTCVAAGQQPQCTYVPTPVDCGASGLVCEAGACVAPPDPCAAAGVCTTPPPPGCQSATVAVTYPAVGTCTASGGEALCSYAPTTVDCGAGGQVCQAGACVAPSPCQAGTCTTPPPDDCASPTERLVYPATGTCTVVGEGAVCDYAGAVVPCPAGEQCQGGSCAVPPDPCAEPGVCTTPPSDDCAAGTLARHYPAVGTCTAVAGQAQCAYPPTLEDCAAGGLACQAGACVTPPDPCAAPGACTTPAADECVSTTTLLHYPNPGLCTPVGQTAVCDYPPTQVTCPAGQVCQGGACVADPCAIPPGGAGFLAYAASSGADYDLRAVRVDGTCDQLLAAGPGDDLAPSWNAAAGRLAWGGTRDGTARVVVMDLADRVQHVLQTGTALATAPALSPDGASVLFEHRVLAARSPDVYRVPAAGGAVVAILYDAAVAEAGPVYGTGALLGEIFYVSNQSGVPEVWRSPATGVTPPAPPQGRVTSGSALPDNGLLGRPALSADGRWLAYTRASATPGSASKIVLHDLQDGSERTLSDHGDSEPAFSPDGARLAVRTTRFGLTDVVLLDVGTGDLVRRLTDGTRLVGTPTFPR